jgi:hypothetical protein
MTEPNYIDWTKIDWKDLYPRLLLLARSKLKGKTWRGTHRGAVPGAPTERDLVQRAILKTIEGERTWNPKFSLYEHLAGVISSEISHLARSVENKITVRSDETVVQIEDHRISPELMVMRKIEEENFLIFLEIKNPALRQLAHLILHESVGSTSEFMNRLNSSAREVDSLKTALRRATREYLDRARSGAEVIADDQRA